MDQKKVGMFIAETRKQKGMTQKELAERLELSDKTISKWETAKSIPDPSLLLLVVLIVLVLVTFGDFQVFQYIFDIVDFGVLFAVDVVLLFMTGLIKDFGRAVKCLFKGTGDRSREQLARALRAVRMVSGASILMGALMAVIALLTMMYNMADFSKVGPPIGHALLSLGYGFGVAILLVPVRMELELVLLE